MYHFQHYKIDFDKVNSIEDVIRALKALDISFEENDSRVHEIEDLVVLVDKDAPKATMD